LIKNTVAPVKILATGTLTKKLNFVSIEMFSVGARSAIESCGGTCA
jgi:ribosomal protein L15